MVALYPQCVAAHHVGGHDHGVIGGLPAEAGAQTVIVRLGPDFADDRMFDITNRILDRQVSPVAGIDRYAVAIGIDQLEIVVTIKSVLSNCIYRHSLFH
jgi:hypothetical protein